MGRTWWFGLYGGGGHRGGPRRGIHSDGGHRAPHSQAPVEQGMQGTPWPAAGTQVVMNHQERWQGGAGLQGWGLLQGAAFLRSGVPTRAHLQSLAKAIGNIES